MAKAKGTVMIGLVKALRREKARARELISPEHAHYLDERIVQAAWYPIADFVALLRLCEKVAPSASGRGCEERGRLAAREHMTGAYNRLSQTTHRRATFSLLASMFDSGQMTVLERRPGGAVLEFSGFALPAREVCEIFTGYNAERMSLLGFDEVRVRHTQCRVDGAPTCRWDLSWKGRESL
jgi:hypothetical protein